MILLTFNQNDSCYLLITYNDKFMNLFVCFPFSIREVELIKNIIVCKSENYNQIFFSFISSNKNE